MRLRRVLVHVQRQIGMIEMCRRRSSRRCRKNSATGSAKMYLREQMKAIQKELGEADDQSKEITELREKLEKLELPKDARTEVDRELARLERSGRESMEAQVIRTYLGVDRRSCPGTSRSDDNLDLARAHQVLEEDHYGLPDVKGSRARVPRGPSSFGRSRWRMS